MPDQKPSILIVDDQPEFLKMLFSILKDDYTVYAAKSGEEALSVAAEQNDLSLILLDVMMQDMNGFEVCKRLKDDEGSKKIPVIFVTAMNAEVDKMMGYHIGGCDYVEKPYVHEELKSKIEQHILRE